MISARQWFQELLHIKNNQDQFMASVTKQPGAKQVTYAPRKGECWIMKEMRDPWADKSRGVRILDARDGWIRYRMGSMFPDERMPYRRFVSIYVRFE